MTQRLSPAASSQLSVTSLAPFFTRQTEATMRRLQLFIHYWGAALWKHPITLSGKGPSYFRTKAVFGFIIAVFKELFPALVHIQKHWYSYLFFNGINYSCWPLKVDLRNWCDMIVPRWAQRGVNQVWIKLSKMAAADSVVFSVGCIKKKITHCFNMQHHKSVYQHLYIKQMVCVGADH